MQLQYKWAVDRIYSTDLNTASVGRFLKIIIVGHFEWHYLLKMIIDRKIKK